MSYQDDILCSIQSVDRPTLSFLETSNNHKFILQLIKISRKKFVSSVACCRIFDQALCVQYETFYGLIFWLELVAFQSHKNINGSRP